MKKAAFVLALVMLLGCVSGCGAVEGEASEVLDREEKIRALRALCEKLTPSHMTGDNFDRAMERSLARTGVWKIRICSLTGKEKPRP
jgi:hypothetical protein